MNGIESIKKGLAFVVIIIFAIPRAIATTPHEIYEEIRIMKDFIDEVTE